PNLVTLVPVFVMAKVCVWLYPPQLLLSVPKARVTKPKFASPALELSDAAPQRGDVPVSDIVPVKVEPVLFVTVKKPVSGPAQIEWLVLHTGGCCVGIPVQESPQR